MSLLSYSFMIYLKKKMQLSILFMNFLYLYPVYCKISCVIGISCITISTVSGKDILLKKIELLRHCCSVGCTMYKHTVLIRDQLDSVLPIQSSD